MICRITNDDDYRILKFKDLEAFIIYRIVGSSYDGTLVMVTLAKNSLIALNRRESWSYLKPDWDEFKFIKFTGKIELSNE